MDPLRKMGLPKHPESKSEATERYTAAFKEIAHNYVYGRNDERGVVILVSHSDGINPFLHSFDQSMSIKGPGHCATAVFEFDKGKVTEGKILVH